MRSPRVWLAAVLLAGAAGCGGEHKASGEVKFPDGKPVEAGQVVFESQTLKCGSACDIKPDGTFDIIHPLPAGEYVVYITDARKAINPGAGVFGPVLVHKKFTDANTSPLRAQVGEGPIAIQVERPDK